MNCQKGDLAIVVESICGNEGKIVRCLELLEATTSYGPGWITVTGHVWLIDIELTGWDGGSSPTIRDSQLRPIRDNPGEDETLTWAPKKEPVPA